ncbi:MAG TPA: hypothetical protein VGY54_08110 [Polyangiaceae bacterium]|jgi:hypothetical protein|nr:hypothetical protein [Polyangiaceae bacterium]
MALASTTTTIEPLVFITTSSVAGGACNVDAEARWAASMTPVRFEATHMFMTNTPRPSFAVDFPRSPELDALLDAFERGDYRRVRSEGPMLERSAADESIKRAARTLVERTQPDPLAVALLALAALLLVALGGWWITHSKPPALAAPGSPTESRR